MRMDPDMTTSGALEMWSIFGSGDCCLHVIMEKSEFQTFGSYGSWWWLILEG